MDSVEYAWVKAGEETTAISSLITHSPPAESVLFKSNAMAWEAS